MCYLFNRLLSIHMKQETERLRQNEREERKEVGETRITWEVQKITRGVIGKLLKDKPIEFKELEFTYPFNIFLLCICSFQHCVRQERFKSEQGKKALFPQGKEVKD